MNQLSKPDTAPGDVVLSSMRDSLFQRISQANPALAQAVLSCSVPRWFDKEVAAGMCAEEIVCPFARDEVFQKLLSLTFCSPHPARANTWAFQRAFRDYFLARRELTDRLQELHSRAAETFKRILEAKGLDGDRRFQDEDWRTVATEWLYHLLQIDHAAGLAALTRMCAESLAIPVYRGPSWEIDFCVRLLTDLEWPSQDEALSSSIEDLRKGFGNLAAGRNVKALPMVKWLAEVPGLTSRQEGELHYFMGITHLYEEGKKGPALEELSKAAELVPDLAKVHAGIAAVHCQPGTTWGRLDLAEESAREAIRVESTQAEGYVALGRTCAQQEEWEQAIAYYEQAIEVELDDTEGYLALSEAYAARREATKAIQLINRAWEIGGWSEYSAAIRRGDVIVGVRDFDRARNEYQRAITLAPDQPATYIALGSWHESVFALTEAAEMYRKAIELDPTLDDGYVALARLYDSQNKLQKAIDTCQNCLARAAAGKAVYVTLCNLYEQQERLSELESVQSKLAALDWGETYGCYCATGSAWLSRARKRRSSPELSTWLAQAQAKIEQAIELDKNRAWAYMLLAELHIMHGETDRLDEIEQTVAARAPWAQYDWLVTVAQTCLQYYDGQRCESLLKRAVDLAPHRTSAWPAFANLCAWQGDPAGVAKAWEKSVQLDPASQYDAHIALGDAYLRVQDHARARQEYSKALKTEPNNAQGYLSLSAVAEAEGSQDEAIELCRAAGERASGLAPIALTSIARIQRDQRRFQTAEETLRRAIDLDPDQAEAYMELACLGVMRDRQDLVAEANERMASVSPYRRYDLYSALGDAYRSVGRFDEARNILEQGRELDPGRADAYVGLAQVSMDQERWEDARASVDRAIEVDPTAVSAYGILSRLYDVQTDVDGVISAQRRIVEIELTERYNACINVGGVYEKTSQLVLAEQQYRKALALCPWRPDAYFALGLVLTQLGKSSEMAELAERAKAEANLSDWPLGAELPVAAGQLWEQRNDPDRARLEYERAIVLDPQRPEGYVALMQLLRAEKRLDDAIQVCQRMAEQPQLAYNASLSLGNLLAEKEDSRGAEEAFRQAIGLAPEVSDAYEQLGQLLVGQRRPEDAAKVYRQMAKQPKLAWKAQVLLGDLWIGQEKPKQAEKAYQQAIKADRQQPAGYLRLARLYQQQGNLDRAESLIEEAKKAAPESSDPSVVLAQLREQQGRADEAIALYRQLAQLRPNEASATYERIGDLLIAQERYNEALTALQQAVAVKVAPANAGAYYSLGMIYEQQANLDQAAAMYSKAIDANPEYHDAYIALGRVYGQQGKKPALESVVQQLINLDLGPADRYRVCLATAELYNMVDETNSAEASCERAIVLDPQRPEGYVALMQLLRAEKRLDDAIQVCQRMAEQPQLAYNASLSLGNLLAEKEDSRGAEEAFRQAIGLAPEVSDAYEQLGQLLVGQRRPEDAAKVYRQMAKQPKLAWKAQVLLGDLWIGQEKPKQAEKAYQQAIKADRQQPAGYLRLARLYQQQGNLDRAESLIEEAKKAAPESSDPSVVLAQLREQQGRADEAIALYRQLAQLRPNEASATYERIGDLLIAQERYNEALTALQQAVAVKVAPANAGAYYSLGMIYEQQANLDQAAAMYSKAIDANPEYHDAYHALCHVYGRQKAIAKIANLSEQLLGQSLDPAERYDAHMAIGAAYQEAQAPEWATDAFKAARDLDSTRTEAYLALGQVYEMQRRWVDARGIYSKLDELVPAWQPDVHRKLGDLYALEGLFSEAEQEYHKVVTLAPERPDGYYGLAQIYMTQKQWSQAAEMWEKLTRLKDVDPIATCSAFLYLADIRRTLGNTEDMLEACSQVISLVNTIESPSSDLLRQKGLALFMQGKYDQATKPLELCMEADPGDVKAHFYLALNLLSKGDRAEADRRLAEGLTHVKDGSEFNSAIREAEVLAASTPEIPGAKEMLEALQKASANTGRQP